MSEEHTDESPLKFPCQFPIKAMGKSGAELESAVLQIVRRHVPEASENDICILASKNGKYSSITLTVTAVSRQQLDAIYVDLTACEHVLYAL